VLLDMMMPGLDGLETLDQLRRIDADVAVIASSGLRTTQRENDVLARGAKAFLPKPYTQEELLKALSHAMKRPS
jgi:CheY-like chemotaxis protein